MLYIYNDAGICAYQQPFQCNLHYIPDLKEIMAKSRDWDELQHTWLEYHHKVGREMRDGYLQLIDLMGEVAQANSKCTLLLCNFNISHGIIHRCHQWWRVLVPGL